MVCVLHGLYLQYSVGLVLTTDHESITVKSNFKSWCIIGYFVCRVSNVHSK